MRSRRLRSARAALLAPLLVVASLAAQTAPAAQQPRFDRAQLEELLRTGFERAIRDRLQLSEADAREFSAEMEDYQRERLDILQRLVTLRRRFEDQGPTGRADGTFLSDAEANRVLAELRAIRNEELDLFNREHARLREMLTPGQAVSFYLLRDQLIQALLRASNRGQAEP